MSMSEEPQNLSRAKKNMDLLTSRKWRYQRVIYDGKEKTPPNHLVEFRKDGKYIQRRGEKIIAEAPWKLSDNGVQIIINWGRTSTRAFIAVSESKLVLKGVTPMCRLGGGRFEETMVAVEDEDRLEDAV